MNEYLTFLYLPPLHFVGKIMMSHMEKEIVGYANEARGHILCSRCFSEYSNDMEISNEVKKEFTPIYKEDEWDILPSCTECGKGILF